jgi:hypothetical protein
MTKEEKDRLIAIAQGNPQSMTKDDREFVKACARELRVQIKNTRCRACYYDAACECVVRMREEIMEEKSAETDNRKYILRPGVDVYFGDIRVNAATLTDELAERIITRGFEKKFFAKC